MPHVLYHVTLQINLPPNCSNQPIAKKTSSKLQIPWYLGIAINLIIVQYSVLWRRFQRFRVLTDQFFYLLVSVRNLPKRQIQTEIRTASCRYCRSLSTLYEDGAGDGDSDEARGVTQAKAILKGIGPSISGGSGGGSTKDNEKVVSDRRLFWCGRSWDAEPQINDVHVIFVRLNLAFQLRLNLPVSGSEHHYGTVPRLFLVN